MLCATTSAWAAAILREIRIEDFLPGLAAVRGLEHPALRILRIGAAQRRHHHHIRIPRIDPQVADMLRLIQANVLPRLTRVCGFVNAVAHIDGAADHAHVARTHVNHVRPGGRHRHRADGRYRDLIEDGSPHRPGVHGLPQTAPGRAHIIDRGIACNTRDRRHAARAEWPDLPPLHARKRLRGNRPCQHRDRGNWKKYFGVHGQTVTIV
jgi:hypothetical protein